MCQFIDATWHFGVIEAGELWPGLGAEAERYNDLDNAGARRHFRGEGDWGELPSPRRVRLQVLAMLALIGGSPERY